MTNILITKQVTSELRSKFSKAPQLNFVEKSFISVTTKEFEDIDWGGREDEQWTSIVVTSPHAATWLLNNFDELCLESSPIIFCSTAKEAAILEPLGLETPVSKQPNGIALAQMVISSIYANIGILYLFGDNGLGDFEKLIGTRNPIHKVSVYNSSFIKHKVEKERWHAILFFSANAVESFVASGNKIDDKSIYYAFGNATINALKKLDATKIKASPTFKETTFIDFVMADMAVRLKKIVKKVAAPKKKETPETEAPETE